MTEQELIAEMRKLLEVSGQMQDYFYSEYRKITPSKMTVSDLDAHIGRCNEFETWLGDLAKLRETL